MRLTHHTATLAARLHATLRGSRLFSARRRLVLDEALSPRELAAYADARLRETIAHAYAHVPYYRRVMQDIGVTPEDIRTTSDLERLPVLTREAVKENFEELRARTPSPGTTVKVTSGSTGVPLRFLTTRAMQDWHDAAKLRAWSWAGYALGTPVALLWGSRLDVKRFHSIPGRLRRLANREVLFDAHDLSDRTCRDYARRMRELPIAGIHGYPNAIHRLAEQVIASGTPLELRFVLTTAETLLPPRRLVIEQAFGAPVFDYYGSRETSMVSGECPAHGGYHVSTDNGVLEIVRDGRAVGPGEVGDVLVTDFHNRAMPLIRYEMGDVARAAEGPCPCGRPFPVFRSVEGRISDMFELRDGQRRTPLMATSLLYPDPTRWGSPGPEIVNVRQWQMIQEDYETFTILFVVKERLPAEAYAYIEDNFRRYVSPDARVHIRYVDNVPTTPDGKRRPIISRVVERRRGETASEEGLARERS